MNEHPDPDATDELDATAVRTAAASAADGDDGDDGDDRTAQRERGPVWRAVTRPAVSTAMALLGLVLVAVSWFGLSGEVRVDEQLPWLLGAGIPGIALAVIGGLTFATRDLATFSEDLGRLGDRVEALHGRLMALAGGRPRGTVGSADPVVVVPSGVTYHRPGCALAAGKDLEQRDRSALASSDRQPCKLCDPDAQNSG